MNAGLDWRGRARHLVLGSVVMLGVVLGIAALSTWPGWQSLGPGLAVVKLSFSHSGVRECRDRTEEELAKLPANMRASQECARRRAPVRIEMDVDGAGTIALDLDPSGIAGSGPSRIYRDIELPVGNHHLELRMRDDPAVDGFTQQAAFDVDLSAAESVAIDFDATTGKFFLH